MTRRDDAIEAIARKISPDAWDDLRTGIRLPTIGERAVQAAMAVLRDEGADSEGGWHSWRCFDRERYPEPCDCTEQVARAALAAAEPHIRAKIAAEIEQHYLGADFGRNPTTGADSPDSHLHDAYDEALNLAARIARGGQS